MSKIKISENIALLRRKKGITQEELAVALGVTNQAVSKWESGKCYPDMTLLPDMASFFDISIDELLGYEHSNKKVSLDTEDTLLSQAIKIAEEERLIYTALFQRKLGIGYSKAKFLIDTMIEGEYITKDETKPNNFYVYIKT